MAFLRETTSQYKARPADTGAKHFRNRYRSGLVYVLHRCDFILDYLPA
jgi:hypothetical protein